MFRFLNATVLFVAVVIGRSVSGADANDASAGKQSSGYLNVSGSKIYYEEGGAGPTIVLLHDGLLHAVSWDEIWKPLTSRFHVIRYDRRGYGRSGPATVSFSPTEDLAKLLQHLTVTHAVIVGSSSGGALAIDFALTHPDMIDGLFLIGPVVDGIEYTDGFRARAQRNNEPMEHDDVRAMARNWSEDKYLVAGKDEKAHQKIYEQLVANADKLKKYESALEEKLSPPASKRLAEIKVPSLILVGEADIADVQVHCDAINAGIRGSNRVMVKEAGHLIQLEKPDVVVKLLKEFVERCARSSSSVNR
jgi:pimeloyl-ACP methyl ester carboxylesterase